MEEERSCVCNRCVLLSSAVGLACRPWPRPGGGETGLENDGEYGEYGAASMERLDSPDRNESDAEASVFVVVLLVLLVTLLGFCDRGWWCCWCWSGEGCWWAFARAGGNS